MSLSSLRMSIAGTQGITLSAPHTCLGSCGREASFTVGYLLLVPGSIDTFFFYCSAGVLVLIRQILQAAPEIAEIGQMNLLNVRGSAVEWLTVWTLELDGLGWNFVFF